jgi:hypothetical protein
MTLGLLDVFGCVPAFDNNFFVSLRVAEIRAVPWITPLVGAEESGWMQTGFRVRESLRGLAPMEGASLLGVRTSSHHFHPL